MMHLKIIASGRSNSIISGSQQDYFVEKSGSPHIYLVVIVHRTNAVIIFGSPTKFLVVLGVPDYHYFDH